MLTHSLHIGALKPFDGRSPRRSWLGILVAVVALLVYAVPAGASAQQLTAEFSNVPGAHDGSVFTFNLTFAPEPALSYVTLRDHAFTVVNGSVIKAERVQKKPARNSEWIIHVQPDLDGDDNPVGDVSITLPATTSCSDQGAICTSGNLPLSNSTEATISAPTATVPSTTTTVPSDLGTESTDVTAVFSEVPESHDGSMFRFTVTFDPEPDLSYATLRDHGFTVVGGTMVKASRITTGTNIDFSMGVVPDLDTNTNPSRAVTITLPATTSCSDLGAVCATEGLMLSNHNEATVPVSEDLPEPPGQPQSVTATPGPKIGGITVTWAAATAGSDLDAAVRGYRLQYDCTGDTVTEELGHDTRSFKITMLDRSRNCLINVAARNDGGYGLAAWAGSDSTFHQPLNPPEAPASITVTDDDDSEGTKVSWAKPASGAAPTSYQVAYWDIDEEQFQYVSHASTTDLEAVIDVAPANLRTVAVRGYLADAVVPNPNAVGYMLVDFEDKGVFGAWAAGWHTSATPSKLDAMTQSSSLSLSLTHSDSDGTKGKKIDLESITGPTCTSVSGLYVDTATTTAWMADSCGAWVHAFDIGTGGTLTWNSDKTLTSGELYPDPPTKLGTKRPRLSPSTLWSDGEKLWVAERDMAFLIPYRLSDGERLHDERLVMFPYHTYGASNTIPTPTAMWSDGDTVWAVDGVSSLIYAVRLENEREGEPDLIWLTRPELRFEPSAFDSCYIPKRPLRSDTGPSATCTDQTALRSAIARADEVTGAYSDGRWLWLAVDYFDRSKAGRLLAFNLLTGERAASRDIALPHYLKDPIGMWTDGDDLWVTNGNTPSSQRLYTFSIPSSG